jgi:hypothetical protein
MFLAEAEGLEAGPSTRLALQAAIDQWQHSPPSVILDHRGPCCRIAQAWLLAMDYSQMNAGDPLTGPRWIRQRHTWGPTRWPIHWCEALAKKTLDCGALAALAKAAFLGRDIRSYTAQLIQRYTREDSKHWYRNWERCGAEISWVKDDLVYHEACAVVPHGTDLRVWDPTASWWVNPKQAAGYGEVLALRILTSDALQVRQFRWGPHAIAPNQWEQLKSTPGDFSVKPDTL